MKKNTKMPVTKGVAKVPVVMQLEALECGAACLTMVLAYYNKWIPLEQIRTDCGVSRDGSNAGNVVKAARHYGLNAVGYRMEPEALRESGSFPCIVHWNFNHFVVVCGFRGNKVYLNDPARGNYSVSMKVFDEAFTGIVLMFSPTEDFAPSGKPKSMLTFAKNRLKGSETALAFAVITGLIAALMGVISPVFSKVFLDKLLSQYYSEWVNGFLILFALFNLISIVMSAIQAVYNLRIDGKMSAVGNSTYMWKILHMPIEFFTQRMAGDIQERQQSNASIAHSLVNTFAPVLLNVGMTIFYFFVMLRYSPLLTLVGIVSLAINGFVGTFISQQRINVTRVSMRDSAKLSSLTISGIEMVETVKSAGAEEGFMEKWTGYQASVNAQKVKFLKMDSYLGLIPQLVSMLANNLILFIGVYMVMQGQFTVGSVMAFQGFLGAFMSPAGQLISTRQTLMEMRTQMERVDDVMEYPMDDTFETEGANDDDSDRYKKLSGKVEIRDLSFGYAPLGDPLITDFNLTVEPGRSVAIVGSSGCGKSTVSKLISGLYKPWSGEILFDGKKHGEIAKSVFAGSLAVVDQDIILFEDTIANNIKMWDDSIEDFEMILAARDARIHEDIMERPGGYKYMLTEGGCDFSGGQRQRIEIARVLAQDPTIIILDEATSALDAKTEYEVVSAIKDRGITCIVIAHRLSTIRSCDEIILMQNGKIVDRGNHEQLMKSSSLYNELVTAE